MISRTHTVVKRVRRANPPAVSIHDVLFFFLFFFTFILLYRGSILLIFVLSAPHDDKTPFRDTLLLYPFRYVQRRLRTGSVRIPYQYTRGLSLRRALNE